MKRIITFLMLLSLWVSSFAQVECKAYQAGIEYSVLQAETVQFSITNFSDSDLTDYSVQWVFNQSDTAVGTTSPIMTFSSAGYQNVVLTIASLTDSACSQVFYEQINIGSCEAGNIGFSTNIYNQSVAFYPTGIDDLSGYEVNWDFGDGYSQSTIYKTTHDYASSGWYYPSISITSLSDPNCTGYYYTEIYIEEPSQSITISTTAHAPVIDGQINDQEVWSTLPSYPIAQGKGESDPISGSFQMCYDKDFIYVLTNVTDPTPSQSNDVTWQADNIELYFAMGADNTPDYTDGDWQIRKVVSKSQAENGVDGRGGANWDLSVLTSNSNFAVEQTFTENGYIQEWKLPLTTLTQGSDFDSNNFKFDIQIGDNNGTGSRTGQLFWNSNSDAQWNNTSYFGKVKFETPIPDDGCDANNGVLSSSVYDYNAYFYIDKINNPDSFDIVWDYGDGTIDTGSNNMEHEYTNGGYFNVSVSVTEKANSTCTYVYKTTIYIDNCFADNGWIDSYFENSTGYFSLSGIDPDMYNITWDFGDGNYQYDSISVSHTFNSDGYYYIYAYVSSKSDPNCAYTYEASTYINNCTSDDGWVDVYNYTDYTELYLSGIDPDQNDITWDLGDGTYEYNTTYVNHTYTTSGYNYITVWVSNKVDPNCAYTYYTSVYVSPPAKNLTIKQTDVAPVIDGAEGADEVWASIPSNEIREANGVNDGMSSEFKMCYDNQFVYVLVNVTDPNPGMVGYSTWQSDCVELFFAMNTENSPSYRDGDWQIRKVAHLSQNGGGIDGSANVASAMIPDPSFVVEQTMTEGGYVQEWKIPIHTLVQSAYFDKANFRFDVQVAQNDGSDGSRDGNTFWNSNADDQWSKIEHQGNVALETPIGEDSCGANDGWLYTYQSDNNIYFSLSGLNDASLYNIAWDFGDSTYDKGVTDVLHYYDRKGSFSVRVTVTSKADLSCSYTYTGNVYIDNCNADNGYIDYYTNGKQADFYLNNINTDEYDVTWNFGDGSDNVYNTANPSHTYMSDGYFEIYTTVTSKTDPNCATTYYSYIYIDGCPADNGWVNESSVSGLTASLYLGGIYESDSVDVVWDYGDGTTESDVFFTSHTYESAGCYYPMVTVTSQSDANCSYTYYLEVCVDACTANDGWLNTDVKGNDVFFDLEGIYGDSVSITWDYGDGAMDYDVLHTSHTYAPGEYYVNVSVKSLTDMTCYGYYSAYVTVENPPQYVTIQRTDVAPQIDGQISEGDVWKSLTSYNATQARGYTDDVAASFKMCYDNQFIYILADVTDPNPGQDGSSTWQSDCIELFFGMNTDNSPSYRSGDWQIRKKASTSQADGGVDGSGSVSELLSNPDFVVEQTLTDKGYLQEWKLPISALVQDAYFDKNNFRFDMQLAQNDGTGVERTGQLFWNSNADDQWSTIQHQGYINFESPISDGCVADDGGLNYQTNGSTAYFNIYGIDSASQVEVTWNFGDSTYASGALYANHTYQRGGQFSVTATVKDVLGDCSYTYNVWIYVEDCSGATLPTWFGKQGLSVYFEAYGNEIFWDFGDGNYSYDGHASHTYQKPGIYTVTASGYNWNGCSVTNKFEVSVSDCQINPYITTSIDGRTVNYQVQVENPELYNISWTFNDSVTAEGAAVSRTYDNDGWLSVTALVQNKYDPFCNTTLYAETYIDDCNANNAYFNVESEGNNTVSFEVGGLSNTDDYKIEIDMGDGSVLDGTAVGTYTYSESGYYEVVAKVISKTDSLCKGYYYENVYFEDCSNYTAAFGYDQYGSSVSFWAYAENTKDYYWDFGDGQTSDNGDSYVSHNYEKPGSYVVTLTTVSSSGCVSTVENTVDISDCYANVSAYSDKLNGTTYKFGADHFFGNESEYKIIWNFGDGKQAYGDLYTEHTYATVGTYWATLSVTNLKNNDCSSTDSIEVYVDGCMADARFDVAVDGLTIHLNTKEYVDTSMYGLIWNIGDNSIDGGNSVSYTFEEEANTTVALYVYNKTNYDCADYASEWIYVQSCDNYSVSAEVSSYGTQTWFWVNSYMTQNAVWDFGDGTTGTGLQASHTYDKPGTYTVILSGTSYYGCSASDTIEIAIDGCLAYAGFKTTTFGLTAGFASEFKDYYSDEIADEYRMDWDFGDSSEIGTGWYPTHTYAHEGAYWVTARVASLTDSSCVEYSSDYVYVSECASNAAFMTDRTGDVYTFASYYYTLDDTANYMFVWNMGDGEYVIGSPVVTHSYAASGHYMVSFAVYDKVMTDCYDYQQDDVEFEGCDMMKVRSQFETYGPIVSAQVWSENSYIDVTWDMGDGTILEGESAVHFYQQPGNYKVVATIYGMYGCVEVDTLDVAITACEAVAGFESESAGKNVYLKPWFKDVLNLDEYNVVWNFGDGTSANGVMETSHTYAASGYYAVTLRITNIADSTCWDEVTNLIAANECGSNASFDFVAIGRTVTYKTTFDIDTTQYEVAWNLGDGHVASGTNITYTYAAVGNYDVTCKVVNLTDHTCFDKRDEQVSITECRALADFTYEIEHQTVVLTATHYALADTAGMSFDWYLGDGTVLSGLPQVEYTYASQQMYHVALVVTDKNMANCANEKDDYIFVKQLCTLTVSAMPSSYDVCYGSFVNVAATTSEANAGYQWSSGDTTENVTLYITSDTSVVVYATSSTCAASDTVMIHVIQLPTFAITGAEAVCAGSDATYTATGSFDSIVWSNSTANNTATYTVATDTFINVTVVANGCYASTSVGVKALMLPVNFLADTISADTALTISANADYSAYKWSTGAETKTIDVTASGQYALTVTSDEGCAATESIKVDIITGIISIRNKNSNMSTYPNPNTGIFTVNIQHVINGNYKIEVFDLQGKVVLRQPVIAVNGVVNQQINMSQYKGVYKLRFVGKNNILNANIEIIK